MKTGNVISIEEGRDVILKIIDSTPLERKELINKCVLALGFTKEDFRKEFGGSNLNTTKSRLGYALNQLIRTGKIIELDDDRLKSTTEKLDSVNLKIEVEEFILSLTSKALYTKEELLNEVSKKYFDKHSKLEPTQDNLNAVKGYAGIFIKTDFVPKSGDKYGTVQESLREKNKRYLATLSSEEFEIHSVKLLEAYYKNFVYKCDCVSSHCGGNNDGGIDGYLTVTDKTLESCEKIYIQVKQKQSENNNAKKKTLHEVREFGGVLATREDALKGIFITNINYNTLPKKFIESYKIKPLLYINGKLWLDLADKCNYSVAEN